MTRTTLEQHHEERGSGPHDGERCACRADGQKWLQMCEAAQAYHDALHALWAADHLKRCAAAHSYRNTVVYELEKIRQAQLEPPAQVVTSPRSNEDLI